MSKIGKYTLLYRLHESGLFYVSHVGLRVSFKKKPKGVKSYLAYKDRKFKNPVMDIQVNSYQFHTGEILEIVTDDLERHFFGVMASGYKAPTPEFREIKFF